MVWYSALPFLWDTNLYNSSKAYPTGATALSVDWIVIFKTWQACFAVINALGTGGAGMIGPQFVAFLFQSFWDWLQLFCGWFQTLLLELLFDLLFELLFFGAL